MLITNIVQNKETLEVIVSDIKISYQSIDKNNINTVNLQKINYDENKSINEIYNINILTEQSFQLPVTI